jgi:hypothetical protein
MDDEKLKHEGLHTTYLGAHLKVNYELLKAIKGPIQARGYLRTIKSLHKGLHKGYLGTYLN